MPRNSTTLWREERQSLLTAHRGCIPVRVTTEQIRQQRFLKPKDINATLHHAGQTESRLVYLDASIVIQKRRKEQKKRLCFFERQDCVI